MADALVGATIQVLLEKSISFATERIGLIIGFKEELQSLRESVEMILVVLADAEDKQRHNQAVQLWLKKLEGVTFDADNVLDQINYEVLRRKVESLNQLKGKVCFFFSFSNTKIAFRWRMASKVREINMKLKKINQEANEFGLIQMAVSLPGATTGMTSSRETDSIVVQKVLGRENDELKIVEMLLSPSEEVVSVIPITGMGGLGKTTLAKSVYNNPKIDEHFKTKIWVVSDISEVKKLFKLILESLWGGRNIEMTGRDAIVKEIEKQLGEKRYLVVLDDVWNKERGLWDDFFGTLVGFSSTIGSKCLVTTRLEQVAPIVSRHDPYLLGRLSDDECWSIIKANAITGGVVPIELNNIKEQVIKRCDGLPLAANAIGGLLRLQRREQWRSIVENRLLNLSEGENDVLQVLKVSFDYLPSAAIKKCFAYCSIFAKDTEIERDLLIEFWMAEGFLLSNVEHEREMEKIGIKYCEILLQSSLLEKGSDTGRTCYRYKMHDLVHDLAQSISRSERVNLENSTITNSYPVRYLALESYGEETEKISKDISPSLRTLFLECSISGDMLSVFKNLHVLNWSGAGLKELPTTIGKLIHLRFLNLSGCEIVTLPESLCKLYNLQTLRFGDEERLETLESLPKQMRNLISLRHLHYKNEDAEFQMPLEIGRLTHLQTLKFFNIGLEKGRRIEELRCLGDLSGSLEIRNLELVNGKEGAEGANLFGKPNLSELKFQWRWDSEYDSYDDENVWDPECDNYDDENVLEGLQPHPNLKKLQIENYMGDHFPQWFINLSTILSNLADLSLTDCKRCKEIPALGQLPFLKKLYLKDMENLVEWMEVDVTSRIDDDEEAVVDVFPMLESLTIKNCSQLTTAPSHFSSLKELRIEKNDHVLVASKILSKVTTLESLKINGMAGLTCVSDLGGLLLNNRSLKYLELKEYPNLTGIRGCFGTSLQDLNISYCKNLKELPEDLCKLRSLNYLKILHCPSIVQFPEGEYNLTSLKHLEICDCNGLTSLPGHMLESGGTSLYFLSVYDCLNLVSFLFDFQKMPSIWYLNLSRCPKLIISDMPKGFGFLIRLRQLSIGPLWSDDSSIEFDWSGLIFLSTLRWLHLYGMPQLESLPDQLQHLTTLKELNLCDFGGVEALPDWIGNLANLIWLHLWNCAKLRYLPSVAAVRCLTNLYYLDIYNCPLLKERCSPQSGPDSEWSKISHIPDLRIY